MTDSESLKLIALLKATYPRQEISKDTAQVYASFLSDLDYSDAERAVREVVAESTFFPSIAEIRKQAAETSTNLPSGPEALALVASRYRLSDSELSANPLPEVREAYRLVGGEWAFRTSTNPTTLHAQFRDLYAQIRADAIRSYQQHGALGPVRETREITA